MLQPAKKDVSKTALLAFRVTQRVLPIIPVGLYEVLEIVQWQSDHRVVTVPLSRWLGWN